MDFTLSKQQLMAQKMYREFAENEVKPLAKQVDAEEYFPKETVEKMSKLGMMGIYFPTSVGGAGGDVLSYVMAVEEMSKVCGTTGVILSAHTSLCAAPIYENGTPEQKAKYLPKLCSGEWLGAFGLTEPGAGTDAQGQQTYAVEREGRLAAERLQDLHHQRRFCRCVHHHCRYRHRAGQARPQDQRDLRLHRRAHRPRLQGRQARGEDGHPRLLYL